VQNAFRRHFFIVIAAVALGFVPTVSGQTADASANKQDGAEASAKRNDDAKKPAGDSVAPVPAGYRVGADDELAISVWHEPELSQVVVVRPDGMITLPLLNDVSVVGLSTEEVQSLLVQKLRPLVNDPQVTVTVKAARSKKVFLVGNVTKQGSYPLTGKMTVLELVAEAGGLGPFAKTGSIYILRKEGGKEIRVHFNYKKALSGKAENPELLPGDMVVVP
jgi:polysaccharide export outer membrane protein